MSLGPGTGLGPYEIVSALGAGGMGEVYRARDTRLKRDVALKTLPESFATDPDRLARFQREAEVLASLSHPNIAGIYGIEESNETRALVMELVEGETLADRIARGPIPIDEALPIARQIAEALEAAHEQGIIHRDLKPANIKIKDNGTVKVLDFGLAKLTESPSTANPSAMSMSPTITSPALVSGVGVLLGTAAYMSPEQAKGKATDKRADIWAFGCVLYEMLTGTRAFEGNDVADTRGAVLRGEADWGLLPVTSRPPIVRVLLARCLEKDPKRRVRDIGDVQLALAGAFETPASSGTGAGERRTTIRRSVTAVIGVAAVAAVIVAVSSWLFRPIPPTVQRMRFTIAPPAAQPFNIQGFLRMLAISPDGSHIAYVAGAEAQLMVRAIDQLEAIPLRGITGAGFPCFSTDGRWVGFIAGGGGDLKQDAIAGGPPVRICHYGGAARGASWGADDVIVFATNDTNTGLLSVSAEGGEP